MYFYIKIKVMAKKKTITSETLIKLFMDYVLMNNENPKSVYKFATDNNFDEALFYKHFASFKNLEQHIFKAFFDHTILTLEKSDDYKSYDTRNKLLSFYFTFFEMLTANRSYVVYALESKNDKLKSLESLKELRAAFQHFIETLDFNLPNIKQETINKIQAKSVKESAWIHLLMTLKFWLDDTSPSFEKTDIFIEKSVHASLDLIDITPLKNVIDFGKFLFKEKMQMN